MTTEDILARLKEDRLDAERARRQARIQQAFDAARTIERRRYAAPNEIDVELLPHPQRRKDDSPHISLERQAAPILRTITATGMSAIVSHRRRHDVVCWDLSDAPEVPATEVPKLYAEAEKSLGFESNEDRLKLNMDSPKQSLWTRLRKEKP